MSFARIAAAAATMLLLCGCKVTVKEGNEGAAANQAANASVPAQPQPAPPPQDAADQLRDLRFVVDVSDRKLQLFNGAQVIGTHDVAVGTSKYPTKTGSWAIHRVDINPEWVPPKDEAWAKEETRKAPGDPENPMGRARLAYDEPRTIHGTDETDSLGKRASHGSIRVANPVVLQLAEMVLKAGGAWQGPQWFGQLTADRTREHQIKLQRPIPIEVRD